MVSLQNNIRNDKEIDRIIVRMDPVRVEVLQVSVIEKEHPFIQDMIDMIENGVFEGIKDYRVDIIILKDW